MLSIVVIERATLTHSCSIGFLFFDTIRDSKVTGHVSLWDGAKVLDNGDHFEKSARIHFWELE